MKRHLLLLTLLGFMIHISSWAQLAKTCVVRASAVANLDGTLTLKWPAEVYTGQYLIYKRSSQSSTSWPTTPEVTLSGDKSSWTDLNAKLGFAYEYFILKTTGSSNDAAGFIYAGNKLKEKTKIEGLILVIDSNYVVPLASEIAILQNDLTSEGWLVKIIIAGRKESVNNIKTRIVACYQTFKTPPRSLFILGHVTVPYAGNFSTNGEAPPPDGHVEGSGNHTGAWPADVFYADMDGNWTDATVNITNSARSKNYNIPGDGKFDQSKLPSDVDLEIGRVDLFDMPLFNKTDTTLERNYLNRNHLFRTGAWKVTERALIDNNFTSYNLAATGYHNFSALFPIDSIFDTRDYFTYQKKEGYLWSYGCGAGSYTSCTGLGTTANFVNDSFTNVYTAMVGSFFGDWDNTNNFLRAPIASKSLGSIWGGIPKWYVHHMAMGEPIGYGAKITQNNINLYDDGGFNSSGNSVHIALMGDPTLTLRGLGVPSQLSAVSSNKKVNLNWNAANGIIDGYCIYILDTVNNVFKRINTNIITDTFYVDAQNFATGNYTYVVRAIKLQNTASGSYYQVGGAAMKDVNHINGIEDKLSQENTLKIVVYPNPSEGIFTLEKTHGISYSNNYQVFDLMGQLVQTGAMENNKATVDLSENNSGIYLVVIEGKSIKLMKN